MLRSSRLRRRWDHLDKKGHSRTLVKGKRKNGSSAGDNVAIAHGAFKTLTSIVMGSKVKV
jgi:hypothetical protein